MKRFAFIFMMMIAVLAAVAIYSTDSTEVELSQTASPVDCGWDTAVPQLVNNSPCPGGVYCSYGNCGEFCCPWGYFYSNPCTCQCYRSSHDAGSDCNTYFRCN